MASDLQELKHYVRNASMVLESIARGRKTTVKEKKILIIERCANVILDLTKLGDRDEESPGS